MKNIILIITIGFTLSSVYANHHPLQDPFKVIAFSGLKMRSNPSMDSKVIKIIPFGESVEIQERQQLNHTVEWLEGEWIKVNYEGRTGYVLDAFLTSLPIPVNDYELSQHDADITYPLLSWVEHNYNIVSKSDTIENHNHYKIVQHFEDGIHMSRKESYHAFQVTVEIPGIRLGDAYNLTRSLLLTKLERELFEEQSLFISNSQSIVDKIKIDLDAPIEISQSSDGVEIKVISYQQVCGL